jgi:hypothetical protein
MLYWISFASETGFLGVVIVESTSLKGAFREATRRGLNPGGEAAVFQIPTARHRQYAAPYRNRLLSRAEVAAVFGPSADVKQVLQAAGGRGAVICAKCNSANCKGH